MCLEPGGGACSGSTVCHAPWRRCEVHSLQPNVTLSAHRPQKTSVRHTAAHAVKLRTNTRRHSHCDESHESASQVLRTAVAQNSRQLPRRLWATTEVPLFACFLPCFLLLSGTHGTCPQPFNFNWKQLLSLARHSSRLLMQSLNNHTYPTSDFDWKKGVWMHCHRRHTVP